MVTEMMNPNGRVRGTEHAQSPSQDFTSPEKDRDSDAFSTAASRRSGLPPQGHLEIQSGETNYVGATHWAAILENVSVSAKHSC